MKFDTVIIGGGLSGLACGIRLLQAGQRCAIVSSGQSALHFSSGSFDLLNAMPNGEEVTDPFAKVGELIKQLPNHPYAKLGEDNFKKLAIKAKQFMTDIEVGVTGDVEKSHYRITPMGTLKPTWLSLADLATSKDIDKLPWKKLAIFNITGFLDFYPRFVADEFAKLGTECDIHHFTLPDIDTLRRNPSELRSTNIARVLDKENNVRELGKILKDGSRNSEAIILPAIIGMQDANVLYRLEELVGKPIFILPTLPPSIVGVRTQQHMYDYFIKHGGVFMLGDSVQKADVENNRVSRIYSYNHQDIPFSAQNYVLATGSYFSQGLIAQQDKVVEPIFNLDVEYAAKREDWYNPNMFETQHYQEYGVKTNNTFNALLGGQAIDNLYVSGAVLEGFNPIKEGSGAGVSILSALYIADKIISK